MARSSPIHRDPDKDGDDYGCYSTRANRQVATGVRRIAKLLQTGKIDDADSLIEHAQDLLETIGDEATDTIVKENVFFALADPIRDAGFEFDRMAIYGW